MSSSEQCVDTPAQYTLKPLPLFGVEATGIDLKEDVPPEVIETIKRDVTQHRIVVFRNQRRVSAQRHVEISKWFGSLRSTFYQHPKTEHPDVFRVSNDETEGCRGVGRTGWHIDGTFLPNPYSHALYHMVEVPKSGDTVFCPFAEFIERMPGKVRAKYERLWMVSDRRSGPIHPVIYRHPLRGDPTMCVHLGMTSGFIWDYGSERERIATSEETREILAELGEMFDAALRDSQCYSHHWSDDFIISDNLSVAHIAAPESQAPRSVVGLRVLHRTTIEGRFQPHKEDVVPL